MASIDTFLEEASARELVNAHMKLAQKISEVQHTAMKDLLSYLKSGGDWYIHKPQDTKVARITNSVSYDWKATSDTVREIGSILDPAGFAFDVHCVHPRASEAEGASIQIIITPLPATLYFYYEDAKDEDDEKLDVENALCAIEGFEEYKDQ